jgi:hypothetical protein
MRFATTVASSTIVTLAALSGLATAQVQQRPSFAGEWVLADTAGRRPSVSSQGDASFRTGSMGSGWGSTLTITQEPTRLIVEYPYFSAYDLQPPIRLTYLLNGQEFRNSVMIGHAASLLRSRATWQGDTLVITTAYPVPDRGADQVTSEIRQALTLESPERLVVETTRAGPAGSAAARERSVYSRR